MRICVLARGIPDEESPLNGIYEWGYAKLLSDCGYAVNLLCVDIRSGRKKRQKGLVRYQKDGIEVFCYNAPIGKVKKSIASIIRFIVAKKIIRSMNEEGYSADIVWTFFGRTLGKTAYYLKKYMGLPYIITEYETKLLFTKLKMSEKNSLKRIYGEASLCTAPNIPFKEYLEKLSNVEFIHLPQIVSVNEHKKVKNKEFTFFSIGALEINKGMDVVIRAFSKVRKLYEGVKLKIIGQGDEFKNLKEQAKSLGVEEDIIFCTKANSAVIKKTIMEGDCLVSASRWESFGVIFLETMAMGVPCVVTDCFVTKSLIPEFAGVVVDVDDTFALSEGMLKVFKFPENFKSEKIKKYIFENFSQQFFKIKVDKILNDLKFNDIQ